MREKNKVSKKDREYIFNELLKSEIVIEEFRKYGECQNYEDMRKSDSDLLRVLHLSIESHGTLYSDIKLYERFTSILNN